MDLALEQAEFVVAIRRYDRRHPAVRQAASALGEPADPVAG